MYPAPFSAPSPVNRWRRLNTPSSYSEAGKLPPLSVKLPVTSMTGTMMASFKPPNTLHCSPNSKLDSNILSGTPPACSGEATKTTRVTDSVKSIFRIIDSRWIFYSDDRHSSLWKTESPNQILFGSSTADAWKPAIVGQLLLWVWVAFHRWPPNGQGWPFARLSGY